MKAIIFLIGLCFLLLGSVGCEEEHEHHHHGPYGGVYDGDYHGYGHGENWHRGDWDNPDTH